MCTRLSPDSRPDPKDGICDRHAVFSKEGIQTSHGDAEECHADSSTASPTPQAPQKADSVNGRPGDLQKAQTSRIVEPFQMGAIQREKNQGSEAFVQ